MGLDSYNASLSLSHTLPLILPPQEPPTSKLRPLRLPHPRLPFSHLPFPPLQPPLSHALCIPAHLGRQRLPRLPQHSNMVFPNALILGRFAALLQELDVMIEFLSATLLVGFAARLGRRRRRADVTKSVEEGGGEERGEGRAVDPAAAAAGCCGCGVLLRVGGAFCDGGEAGGFGGADGCFLGFEGVA